MKKTKIAFVLCCAMALQICISSAAEQNSPKIRVSAWYWLNSAPKADWEEDFVTMKNLGFTDVLLCWGVDLTGITTRKADTKQAMQWAHKAGIGVYLIVWQPHANSLKRIPEYLQVDPNGKKLNSFDVFNPEWRSTEWKTFLQDVAITYANEPAMAGYAFDDSFGGSSVSYGPYEQKMFGGPLPKKPDDPGWEKWTKLRNDWWEDWARDTVGYIRAIDPNPRHVIYLEDTIASITSASRHAATGVDFPRVAKHFDAVGGYTVPKWTDETNSDERAVALTRDSIRAVRKMVGEDKKVVYTFWSANGIEERNPGPAKHPTASEIRQICDAALQLGIKHLDMYGYRIGEYKVSIEDMVKMMPPEPAPYTLTGQFPEKFMWDRPEIHQELSEYLHSLNEK